MHNIHTICRPCSHNLPRSISLRRESCADGDIEQSAVATLYLCTWSHSTVSLTLCLSLSADSNDHPTIPYVFGSRGPGTAEPSRCAGSSPGQVIALCALCFCPPLVEVAVKNTLKRDDKQPRYLDLLSKKAQQRPQINLYKQSNNSEWRRLHFLQETILNSILPYTR